MKLHASWLGIAVLGIALTLSACGQRDADPPPGQQLTLRTYAVPNGSGQNVSETLNSVLSAGREQALGHTRVVSPGRVIVLAPETMQDSIATSIKQIARSDADSAEKTPMPVRLSVWTVDAVPGTGPADARLKAIEPALTAFARTLGPTHFALKQHFGVVTGADVGGGHIHASSEVDFQYELDHQNNALVLKFSYSDKGTLTGTRSNGAQYSGPTKLALSGTTNIEPAHTLVLGLLSNVARSDTQAADTEAASRLLVVRVDPVGQG